MIVAGRALRAAKGSRWPRVGTCRLIWLTWFRGQATRVGRAQLLDPLIKSSLGEDPVQLLVEQMTGRAWQMPSRAPELFLMLAVLKFQSHTCLRMPKGFLPMPEDNGLNSNEGGRVRVFQTIHAIWIAWHL